MKPVHFSRRFLGGIVPEPDVVAVGVVDERPDSVLLLQTIGVDFCLRATRLGINGRLLGFDYGKRLFVFTEEDVIGLSLFTRGGLMWNFEFLTDLGCFGLVLADLPASLS